MSWTLFVASEPKRLEVNVSRYIAYVCDHTWKHCETLEEANNWNASLSAPGFTGAQVYVNNAELAEVQQRLAAAEAWNEFVHTQNKCEWTYDETSEHYDTGCGKAWCFQEDGIKENGLRFCPFCGGFVRTTECV